MKVKNIFIISISFIVISLVLCVVAGLISVDTSILLKSSRGKYMTLFILSLFLKNLFPLLLASFLISFVIEFGRSVNDDPASLKERFSVGQQKRYIFSIKVVIVTIFLLTLVDWVYIPMVTGRITALRSLPDALQDYKEEAKGLFRATRYSRAYDIAKSVLLVNPDDVEAKSIMEKAEAAMVSNRATTVNRQPFPPTDNDDITKEKNTNLTQPKDDRLVVPLGGSAIRGESDRAAHKEEYTLRDLVVLARRSWLEKDYFSSHYYSTLAIKMIENNPDPAFAEMNRLSLDSWAELEKAREGASPKESELFARKMEGFNALMQGDYTRSYAIFYELSQEYPLDPDAKRHLAIAQQNLENDYFWADDVSGAEHKRVADRNVHFKITLEDGSCNLYFIKEVLRDHGGYSKSDFYMRGLSILKLSKENEYLNGVYYPYARATISDDGIELFLKGIDRTNAQLVFDGHVFFGGSGDEAHLTIPVSRGDFNLLCATSRGLDSMNVGELGAFSYIATRYGYAEAAYSCALLNQIFLPLFFLITFSFILLIAFQYRMRVSIFKAQWALSAPVAAVLFYFLTPCLRSLFSLVNFGLFNKWTLPVSIAAGFGFYMLIFCAISLVFLSCDSRK